MLISTRIIILEQIICHQYWARPVCNIFVQSDLQLRTMGWPPPSNYHIDVSIIESRQFQKKITDAQVWKFSRLTQGGSSCLHATRILYIWVLLLTSTLQQDVLTYLLQKSHVIEMSSRAYYVVTGYNFVESIFNNDLCTHVTKYTVILNFNFSHTILSHWRIMPL